MLILNYTKVLYHKKLYFFLKKINLDSYNIKYKFLNIFSKIEVI